MKPTRVTAGPRALRAWRKRQSPKLTQAELGRKVGISGSYIRHYEIGSKDLPVPVKIRLATLTGIPLETLLTPEQKAIALATARAIFEKTPAAGGRRG